MKETKLIQGLDENGRKIVKVSLVNSDKYATLDQDDYLILEKLGVSFRWYYGSSTLWNVMVVLLPTKRRKHLVSRVIMDVGKGQILKFLNGDKTDMRRCNLVIARGSGKMRPRQYVGLK